MLGGVWVALALAAAAAATTTKPKGLWAAVMVESDVYFATHLSLSKLGSHLVCGIRGVTNRAFSCYIK